MSYTLALPAGWERHPEWPFRIINPKELYKKLRTGKTIAFMTAPGAERASEVPKTQMRTWFAMHNMIEANVGYLDRLRLMVVTHDKAYGSPSIVSHTYWIVLGIQCEGTDDELVDMFYKDQALFQRYVTYINRLQLVRLVQRIDGNAVEKPLTKLLEGPRA